MTKNYHVDVRLRGNQEKYPHSPEQQKNRQKTRNSQLTQHSNMTHYQNNGYARLTLEGVKTYTLLEIRKHKPNSNK